MPRKDQGWITFQATPEEREILESYCQQNQRSKTEVLRELIRRLDASQLGISSQAGPSFLDAEDRQIEVESPPFQVSARNLLRGRITNLYRDGVNTEVTLEVANNVAITSVITSTSAQRLGLKVGKVVYAMVKSSNVMIATSDALQQFAEGFLT